MTNIITDAELVNQYAAKALEEPAPVIETRAPSESTIELPGGFIEMNGEVIKTVEVKELTGADEEAVARAGSTAKAFNTLLQRGLISLGSREPKKEDFDTLLAGDRDAILLGIRRATFGDELPLVAVCQSCGVEQDVKVHLVDDVPVKKLEDPVYDRVWEVETSMGTVRIGLPTGTTQRRLFENADKTAPEINTLLLTGCILSVNGMPTVGTGTALRLGMADRGKIINEIIDRNPGPRLGEVKKACQACGEDIPLPFSLFDLFRF